ncbi:hypothetical protein [Thiovibrio frasassiensis]|uniref:Uncharacterized protein n=1 Tax=Thiovibrio frasassiensis TaxID=2984131 RepID=A0A9X4MFM2_9BACT|nr:hypothetical protein [Thiovibrio frasassiensis]MDG4475380.1 hypothetical protein [Thiovibrio frasassiensis]
MTRTSIKAMLIEATVFFILGALGCWLSYRQGKQEAYASAEPMTSTDNTAPELQKLLYRSAIAIEVQQTIIYAKECLNAAARFGQSHAFLPTDSQKSPILLLDEISQAAQQLHQQRKDRRLGQLFTVSLRMLDTEDPPLSEAQCFTDIVSFFENSNPPHLYYVFKNEGISVSFLFITNDRADEMKLSGSDERVRIQLQDHFMSKGFAIVAPEGLFDIDSE